MYPSDNTERGKELRRKAEVVVSIKDRNREKTIDTTEAFLNLILLHLHD